MARSPRRSIPDLQSALEASGLVGTWLYDIPTSRISLSAPVARLIGLVPEAAEHGLALPTFVAALHGADQARTEGAVRAAGERGGPCDLAFRTRDGTNRILLHGRIDRDAAGRPARGCGIALAMAEEGSDVRDPQEIANRMAERAMDLRELATRLDRPGLSTLVERLMVEIGFELVRHLKPGQSERRH